MKKLVYFVALATISLAACKGNENKQAEGKTDSAAAPVSTPAAADSMAKTTQYTCPMHPEVISDKPGQCPKCGMDLQPKS